MLSGEWTSQCGLKVAAEQKEILYVVPSPFLFPSIYTIFKNLEKQKKKPTQNKTNKAPTQHWITSDKIRVNKAEFLKIFAMKWADCQ